MPRARLGFKTAKYIPVRGSRDFPMDYYWTVHQSEWATDVMFGKPADLAAIYPALVLHGMQNYPERVGWSR